MLTDKGAAASAACLIDDATVPKFNASNARVGVGDSSAAYAVTQTDLQAVTNKFRKLVQVPPLRTVNSLDFNSKFSPGEATFAWNELAVFNSPVGDSMLTRRTISLGTKTASDEWEITATVIFTPASS